MVGIAVACGLAGAFGAVVCRLMIRTVSALARGGPDALLELAEEGLLAEVSDPRARELSWGVRLLVPAAGGLLVGPLSYFFAREARGHGVVESVVAGLVGVAFIYTLLCGEEAFERVSLPEWSQASLGGLIGGRHRGLPARGLRRRRHHDR